MLINPTQHRRDDCQKHCHYGCYDSCDTFIDLEFDVLLFEQFFFCVFLLPFPQMASSFLLDLIKYCYIWYVYIITRNCVFVNRFTSCFSNFLPIHLSILNLIMSRFKNRGKICRISYTEYEQIVYKNAFYQSRCSGFRLFLKFIKSLFLLGFLRFRK